MTEISAVYNSYAQWVSCNEYNTGTTNTKDESMTETSAVYNSYA